MRTRVLSVGSELSFCHHLGQVGSLVHPKINEKIAKYWSSNGPSLEKLEKDNAKAEWSSQKVDALKKGWDQTGKPYKIFSLASWYLSNDKKFLRDELTELDPDGFNGFHRFGNIRLTNQVIHDWRIEKQSTLYPLFKEKDAEGLSPLTKALLLGHPLVEIFARLDSDWFWEEVTKPILIGPHRGITPIALVMCRQAKAIIEPPHEKSQRAIINSNQRTLLQQICPSSSDWLYYLENASKEPEAVANFFSSLNEDHLIKLEFFPFILDQLDSEAKKKLRVQIKRLSFPSFGYLSYCSSEKEMKRILLDDWGVEIKHNLDFLLIRRHFFYFLYIMPIQEFRFCVEEEDTRFIRVLAEGFAHLSESARALTLKCLPTNYLFAHFYPYLNLQNVVHVLRCRQPRQFLKISKSCQSLFSPKQLIEALESQEAIKAVCRRVDPIEVRRVFLLIIQPAIKEALKHCSLIDQLLQELKEVHSETTVKQEQEYLDQAAIYWVEFQKKISLSSKRLSSIKEEVERAYLEEIDPDISLLDFLCSSTNVAMREPVRVGQSMCDRSSIEGFMFQDYCLDPSQVVRDIGRETQFMIILKDFRQTGRLILNSRFISSYIIELLRKKNFFAIINEMNFTHLIDCLSARQPQFLRVLAEGMDQCSFEVKKALFISVSPSNLQQFFFKYIHISSLKGIFNFFNPNDIEAFKQAFPIPDQVLLLQHLTPQIAKVVKDEEILLLEQLYQLFILPAKIEIDLFLNEINELILACQHLEVVEIIKQMKMSLLETKKTSLSLLEERFKERGIDESTKRVFPDKWYCEFTGCIAFRPINVKDHIYDKSSILRNKHSDPKSKEVLAPCQLILAPTNVQVVIASFSAFLTSYEKKPFRREARREAIKVLLK